MSGDARLADTIEVPTISVVIATHRRRENLPRVLAPLLADPGAAEILVVVDGDDDGSFAQLERLAAGEPRVRPFLISNQGQPHALQHGVERAAGEVVLLLDDDVIAEEGMVSRHARRHQGQHGLVVVGYMPTVVSPRRQSGDFTTRLYARDYERCVDNWRRDPSAILLSLWGGNVSLRRADCLSVRLARADFRWHRHADWDFGLRCREAGLTGVFAPELTGRHAHSRSLGAFLAEGRHSSADRLVIHRLHRDVLGPIEPDYFEQGAPPWGRWLIRTMSQPPLMGCATTALKVGVRVAGLLRMFDVEEKAAHLLRRIIERHSATPEAEARAAQAGR